MADTTHKASRRAVLAALAVAPTAAIPTTAFAGDPSEWEKKLKDYRLKKALSEADAEFGAMADAERAHQLARTREESRPGEKKSPAQERAWEAINAAETLYYDRYTAPYWTAARALVMTPAPTVEALVEKIAIIRDDEVWNDGKLPGEAMDYVLADARRLGAEIA